MKKVILSLMFLLLCAGYSQAGGIGGEYNGVDWVKWDDEKKGTFVAGFVAGSNYVIWGNLEKLGEYNEEEADRVLKKYLKASASQGIEAYAHDEAALLRDISVNEARDDMNKNLLEYVIYNAANKNIKSALDDLYKEERNRGIGVTDAIFVVKKRITGTPEEDIEKILAYLRDGKQLKGTLLVKDETGLRYIPFP